MTHLRLYETPNLGVHQTGSSSMRSFSVKELEIDARPNRFFHQRA
jgi:hypothetical protein